jgi:ATP-binding cassette, subfamily B, bacterial PglK
MVTSEQTISNKALRRRQSRELSLGRTARRMLEIMSSSERRRLWLLTPVITVNALMQVVGIASVMPFLSLIANPDVIREQWLLAWLYDTLGFEDTLTFTIFAGVGVLALLVLSNAFAAVSQYLMVRFSWGVNHTMSVRMLRTYLFKPYVFFLDQNTAGMAKNILGEVKHAVKHFVVAGMNLAARGVVAAFIIALLIVVHPLLSLATFAFLGLAYGGVYLLVQRGMTEGGEQRAEADRQRYKAASEALGGVKEIKLLGKEQPFLQRFERPSRRYARTMARQAVVSMLPRYGFETIAFGGMVVVVLFLLAQGEGVTGLLPTLGVYAFASYRLLPALQGMFQSMTELRFSLASVEVLHRDLERTALPAITNRDDVEPLPFRSQLELRDVSFTYPNARAPLFEGFHLVVEANTSVAIVGATGAGKTTAVDLLLGLLQPQTGHLVVDGVVVGDEVMASWQKSLGYVPQVIYLADDTVAANIALGVPSRKLDMESVELAAKRANIHDFIVNELPKGYQTEIGERGVRLSGGQRQRLGIARALFHDPPVLIFDEATSALDNVTEESIFNAVTELGTTKTIVMIAHRISTVRDCDVIYVLDRGRVVVRGSYSELIDRSPEFRALARVDRAGQMVPGTA